MLPPSLVTMIFTSVVELWAQVSKVTFADVLKKLMLHFYRLIACKSDLAELLKSWFSVNNITENSRSCQLDLGRFLGIFWLFLFKIFNQTRLRMWKRPRRPSRMWKSPQRPPRTSNHWKSTLTSCRSVDWPNFRA